jgi:hypothetical protein
MFITIVIVVALHRVQTVCSRVWDALTGLELLSFEHKHIVRTCAFSEVSDLTFPAAFGHSPRSSWFVVPTVLQPVFYPEPSFAPCWLTCSEAY